MCARPWCVYAPSTTKSRHARHLHSASRLPESRLPESRGWARAQATGASHGSCRSGSVIIWINQKNDDQAAVTGAPSPSVPKMGLCIGKANIIGIPHTAPRHDALSTAPSPATATDGTEYNTHSPSSSDPPPQQDQLGISVDRTPRSCVRVVGVASAHLLVFVPDGMRVLLPRIGQKLLCGPPLASDFATTRAWARLAPPCTCVELSDSASLGGGEHSAGLN
jgi:hypothetical protein